MNEQSTKLDWIESASHDVLLQILKEQFARAYSRTGLDKTARHTHGHKMHEDLVGALMPVIFDYPEGINLNDKIKKDFPAIDFGYFAARTAVQVTATTTPTKVKETIKGFLTNHFDDFFDKLIMVFLAKKDGSYTQSILNSAVSNSLKEAAQTTPDKKIHNSLKELVLNSPITSKHKFTFESSSHILDLDDLYEFARLDPQKVKGAVYVFEKYYPYGPSGAEANPKQPEQTQDLIDNRIRPKTQLLIEEISALRPLKEEIRVFRDNNVFIHPSVDLSSGPPFNEILERIISTENYSVFQISGHPGTGKSVFLQRVFLKLAGNFMKNTGPPVLMIELSNSPRSLRKNFKHRLLRETFNYFDTHKGDLNEPPLNQLKNVAEKHNLVIMIDGLGSFSSLSAKKLVNEIINSWPGVRLIVDSYPSGDKLAPNALHYDFSQPTLPECLQILSGHSLGEPDENYHTVFNIRTNERSISRLKRWPLMLSLHVANEASLNAAELATLSVRYLLSGAHRRHAPEGSSIHSHKVDKLLEDLYQVSIKMLSHANLKAKSTDFYEEQHIQFIADHCGMFGKETSIEYSFFDDQLALALAADAILGSENAMKLTDQLSWPQINRPMERRLKSVSLMAAFRNATRAVSWLSKINSKIAVESFAAFLKAGFRFSSPNTLMVEEILLFRDLTYSETTRERINECKQTHLSFKYVLRRLLSESMLKDSGVNPANNLLLRVLYREVNGNNSGDGKVGYLQKSLKFTPCNGGSITSYITWRQFSDLLGAVSLPDRNQHNNDRVFNRRDDEPIECDRLRAWAFCFALADQFLDAKTARLPTTEETLNAVTDQNFEYGRLFHKMSHSDGLTTTWCSRESEKLSARSLRNSFQASSHPVVKWSVEFNSWFASESSERALPFRVFIPNV